MTFLLCRLGRLYKDYVNRIAFCLVTTIYNIYTCMHFIITIHFCYWPGSMLIS